MTFCNYGSSQASVSGSLLWRRVDHWPLATRPLCTVLLASGQQFTVCCTTGLWPLGYCTVYNWSLTSSSLVLALKSFSWLVPALLCDCVWCLNGTSFGWANNQVDLHLNMIDDDGWMENREINLSYETGIWGLEFLKCSQNDERRFCPFWTIPCVPNPCVNLHFISGWLLTRYCVLSDVSILYSQCTVQLVMLCI